MSVVNEENEELAMRFAARLSKDECCFDVWQAVNYVSLVTTAVSPEHGKPPH